MREATRTSPSKEFIRNAVTLMSGTALAQLAPIAASPLLTRLYLPADFGQFAMFGGLSAILAIIGTGRFDLAILVPKREALAHHLLIASFFCAAGTALLAALIIALWMGIGNGSLGLGWKLGLLPLSALLASAYQGLTYWLNRKSAYRALSINRAAQSVVFVIAACGLGSLGFGAGLIVALVLGQATALMGLLVYALRLQPIFSSLRKSAVWVAVRRYRNFPKLLISAHLLNVASYYLPTLALPWLFNSHVAGMYALTHQTINLPILVVAGAIGDVFRQQAGHQYAHHGNCQSLYVRTFKWLASIAILPAIALAMFAPPLFGLLFGETWREAGVFAQILAPVLLMRFIASPLSAMFMIAEKQALDIAWQMALAVLTLCAMVVGWGQGSPHVAIALFSAAYVTMFAVNLAATYRFARGNR